MSKIKISPKKDHFLKNGGEFFYLAGAVWSAFTNASFEDYRKRLIVRNSSFESTLSGYGAKVY